MKPRTYIKERKNKQGRIERALRTHWEAPVVGPVYRLLVAGFLVLASIDL